MTKNNYKRTFAAVVGFIGLAGILWQSGALSAFFRAEQDRPRPVSASLVGTWSLRDASPESSIRLFADGRFEAAKLPVEDPSGKQSLSGEGYWVLDLRQAWMLVLEFQRGQRPVLYVDFSKGDFESARPVGFSYPMGDLDSTERWTWRRAKSEAGQ